MRLFSWIEANHCVVTEDPVGADLHLVNTSGSDARQAALTWDHLRNVYSEQPVILAGCLVSIDPEGVRAALAPFPRNVRINPRQLVELDRLLEQPKVSFDQIHRVEGRYSVNNLSSGSSPW